MPWHAGILLRKEIRCSSWNAFRPTASLSGVPSTACFLRFRAECYRCTATRIVAKRGRNPRNPLARLMPDNHAERSTVPGAIALLIERRQWIFV